ncbi:MAG: tetratricopeptide repeat protein [Phaeodactylibacter sp.]|nr:tetratricopeptide repeat protein [Phaeodactylibacter sp.]
MRKHWIFFAILSVVAPATSWAQNARADSLKAAIADMGEDTVKVEVLLELSSAVFRSDPDTAIVYANQAMELSKRLNYPKGLGYALKNMGLAHYVKGDFVEVLNYWHQSLEIFESINDQLGISNLNNNIGAVHFNYGDDPKALEYYLESLRAAEQLGDKLRVATALMNIGAVYFNKPSTHDKALDYYRQAVAISEETGDLDAIGTAAANLGEVYMARSDYPSALANFRKALDAMERTGGNASFVLTNIGKAYAAQGDLGQAIKFHKDAIQIAERKNARQQLAQALVGLADAYRHQGTTSLALENYRRAETIAREVGLNGELKDAYQGLARSYAELSDYNNAFKYQTLFGQIRDTLYNIESDKRMANIQFQFDLEKKEAEIELLRKEQDLSEAAIQRANILRNFLFAVAAFLAIILAGIYYQYRYAQKSNKIISEERNRAEQILLNILPAETAEELKANGFVEAKRSDMVTVLFTDFKEFTKIAESNSPEHLVKSIDYYFTHFDEIITRNGLEKIKTIGDAYMCAGGLPAPNNSNPKDAVRAALEMADFVRSVRENRPEGILPFDIRLGINTGPVVAGVVGIKKFQYDIWGATVNLAARMESSSAPGRINISENTFELVKDEFECEYRGEIEAKNGDHFKMYFVKHNRKKP